VAVAGVAVAGERSWAPCSCRFSPAWPGGALRGQIEAVRVRADRRGFGLGTAMLGWAVDEARRRHCALVQLTTDTSRPDAHRCYERLGFVASHEGFELVLDDAS
jgi:GNAT superfamily N-acetyltransferase